MSRLWSDPPLKDDGSLDYARLTLGEVYDDLLETLADLVVNGQRSDYERAFEEIDAVPMPDEGPVRDREPPAELVAAMERLLAAEQADPNLAGDEAHQLVDEAVRLLRIAVEVAS